MNYGEKALPVARRELGVKESPADSNDGPRVRVYQETTKAYRQAWCASFVTWVLKQVGFKLDAPSPAYVPSIEQWGRQHGYVVRQPQPGDLALYDWERNGEADHIGIVSHVYEDGYTFQAIEGNTAFGNDSNGGEVMERTRSTANVRVFLRLPAVPDATPRVDVVADGKVVNTKQKITNPALLKRVGNLLKKSKTVTIRRSK